MNTLSNVNDRRGGTNPPYDGLTSNVILEVQSQLQDENSDTGVSSLYVPIENHQWFVLRATYNRVEKDIETLELNIPSALRGEIPLSVEKLSEMIKSKEEIKIK